MLYRFAIVLSSLIMLFTLSLFVFTQRTHAQTPTTFWKYQCIDTMKDSRDRARSWMNDPASDKMIAKQMKEIKALGANCVAIATPYDEEFLPILTKWVKAAREQNLKIWFRGNFSGWEGWFDYPLITTTEEELIKIESFIKRNPNLFKDGDIFTGAPEAENGGPFEQVNQSNFAQYRQFLIDQDTISQRAFKSINKQIVTNWFSMNGDVARNMYDKETLSRVGNLVTVDHYINDPQKMSEIIEFFKTNYNSTFMLGEFGAPIPDINGVMTEDQQAAFVDSVLKVLYQKRESVLGVNYWVYADGSTAIVNADQSPRKVTSIIKKYFNPAVVTGKVTNQYNNPVANISVKTDDNTVATTTDSNGNFSLPTIASSITLTVSNADTTASASVQNMKPGKTYRSNIVVQDKNLAFPTKLKELFQRFFIK